MSRSISFFFSHLHPANTQRRWRAIALTAMITVIAIVSCWSVVHAITLGTLTLDRIEGDGWIATGIALDVDLEAEPIKAHIRVDRLQLGALGTQADRVLRNISADCTQIDIEGVAIRCASARISGVFPSVGYQTVQGSVRFNRHTHALAMQLAGIKIGGGIAQISGDWRGDAWSARLQLQQGSVAEVYGLLKSWFQDAPTITATGNLDIDVMLQGRGEDLGSAEWRLRTRQLTASNSTGTLASDQLDIDAHGSLNRVAASKVLKSPNTWQFTAELASNNGQAYAEPVFLNFQPNPLSATVAGDWLGDGAMELRKFSIEHANALSASGHATLLLGEALRVEHLHADILRADLPGAYISYLQPFLLNGALGSLTTQGSMSGSIDVVANTPIALLLDARDISADDSQHRWSVSGLHSAIRWRKQRDGAAPPTSELRWQSAHLFGIDAGAAAIQFATTDRDFALVQAVRIPIMDGGIEIAGLQIENAGAPEMALQLDATLQPISMQRLCAVFGWPSFGGHIGGRLADLQLRKGVLTFGTTLQADVFDGRVSIADLRLDQLFGNWPRLSASIAIDQVDLEQVTSAFSFGLITGRLSGAINNLRLFNWSPAAFDANLYTPANDRTRHRISQRAVNNIGNLGGSGGGVAVALSSGFLRFFENFNYDRIGIRCKLENNICHMGGVESADNGYYLVKGRGVPRIDVVGNASRVDWPRLVAQLQAATQSRGLQIN